MLLTVECNQNYKNLTSQNTVGPQVMLDKTGSSSMNKHKNTGPTDRQNLAYT